MYVDVMKQYMFGILFGDKVLEYMWHWDYFFNFWGFWLK